MTSTKQYPLSSLRLATLAAALAAAGAVHAGVAFDANLELDITNRSGAATNGAAPIAQSGVGTSGRVELNANAELLKNGDNFVTARATMIVPVATTTGGVDKVGIDDAWLKFGNSSVDFKLGRHEAADLFPVGKDTVLDVIPVTTGPTGGIGYRANALRGRVTDGRLHAVLGLNASPELRIELGLVTEDKSAAGATKAHGLRPTLVYSTGPLALRAGVESFKIGTTSYTGTGLSAGYAFAADSNVNAN